MVKKILTVLIAALFFIFVGLLVLFFYLRQSQVSKSAVLSFIPTQTQVIIRITETAPTINQFVKNPVVMDCFQFDQIKAYWQAIDSVTSRNYKTTEVLQKNTSYLCIDSALNYLILVDLDKKTNEHFIDQFLVSLTPSKKMEKYKEGYKAFFPSGNQPIYYFVKQHVFGVSGSEAFIKQSIFNGNTHQVNENYAAWDHSSKENLAIWGKSGAENLVMNQFVKVPLWGGWLDKLSKTFSFDVKVEPNGFTCTGQLKVDTLNTSLSQFAIGTDDFKYPFFDTDSGAYQNYYFSFSMPDSNQVMQACSFTFTSFMDSTHQPVQLIVSTNALAIQNFNHAIDTSVQVISMADNQIHEIAVMDNRVLSHIIPLNPFMSDTAKWFGTIYNGSLFIANSTEAVLNHVPQYPSQSFIKTKLNANYLIFSSSQVIFKNRYTLQYKFQLAKNGQLDFSSTISKREPN